MKNLMKIFVIITILFTNISCATTQVDTPLEVHNYNEYVQMKDFIDNIDYSNEIQQTADGGILVYDDNNNLVLIIDALTVAQVDALHFRTRLLCQSFNNTLYEVQLYVNYLKLDTNKEAKTKLANYRTIYNQYLTQLTDTTTYEESNDILDKISDLELQLGLYTTELKTNLTN